MFHRLVNTGVLSSFGLLILTLTWAGDSRAANWPMEIQLESGVVVVYQPQPETLKGNRLTARVAVAVEPKDSKEPVFGAVWFDARLETDRAERTVTITDLKVSNVRFPNADEQKRKQLSDLLEKEIPKWNIPMSLDALLVSLEVIEQRAKAAEKISTDPPEIIFIEEPAILVVIDGEPQQRDEKNTKLKRVINTAFTLLFDPASKTYYLNADSKTWYTAKDIKGDWTKTNKVPQEVATLAPKEDTVNAEAGKTEADKAEPGPPPKILVRTKPAELISTKGKPEFKSIEGTDLLYMSNTESDVLMEIKQQKYYILLSGRWYVSTKMQGPWKYVAGEKLPKDFAKIPEDSNLGTVLYAVPGTKVAEEAVMDAQIPQTAAVDRSKAALTVEYDGEPKFEKISTTSLSYAVNTATPVIKLSSQLYYACDEAVWFEATSPAGAWKIATSVPDVIYTIPPDSPMYYVTFVKVYKVEPEVIYVGYTPGYTNTYIYGTTIVYGTGYWWPGWYGRYYYPHYATWGYHVRWNPYTGWRFGFSYGASPYLFAFGHGGWYRGGWWGPGHYRGYRGGYRHGYRRGARAGYRAGYRSGKYQAKQNMYRSQKNRTRATPTKQISQQARAKSSANRKNNVYTDRSGNLHRKTDQGWQSRNQDGWQSIPKANRPPQKPSNQPSQRPSQQPSQRPAQQPSHKQTRPQSGSNYQQQLNRSYQSRQQGAQRSQNYNRARSGGAVHGGARGGGGRHR